MLEARDISKNFGNFKALEKINIIIQQSSITALIGPSGAGKTTILRALSLIDPPTNGEILVDDMCFSFPKANNLFVKPWPKLTVVFQQLFLWPHLTILDNVMLPLKQIKSNNSAYAEELIDFFELIDCKNRFPYEVSIGQRQRAAIVRAISLKPRYLLLDEVTSALDVEQISKLANCLNKLRDNGCGILIVTHLLGFAKVIANRYLFIENGRILEDAKIQDLNNPENDRVKEFVSFM